MHWLIWTTTGDVNLAGPSERYLGSQLEFRLRYEVLLGNVRLEARYARRFAGDYIDNRPSAGDSDCVYSQIVLDC